MTREELIRNLKHTMEKHKNDNVPTFGTNTSLMCRDLLDYLEQEPKIRHCKDCTYFEYDSVAKVDGIPLIVAHEICSRWGDGCKTKEDGYCFLFEQKQESKGDT